MISVVLLIGLTLSTVPIQCLEQDKPEKQSLLQRVLARMQLYKKRALGKCSAEEKAVVRSDIKKGTKLTFLAAIVVIAGSVVPDFVTGSVIGIKAGIKTHKHILKYNNNYKIPPSLQECKLVSWFMFRSLYAHPDELIPQINADLRRMKLLQVAFKPYILKIAADIYFKLPPEQKVTDEQLARFKTTFGLKSEEQSLLRRHITEKYNI